MPNFYGPIDLLKNELRQPVAQNLASAPASPVLGQFYYNTADSTLYYCTNPVGPIWTAAKAGAGATPGSSVTISAVADASVVGGSNNFAREDHKHGREAFGVVGDDATGFGTALNSGSAVTVARSDHRHGNPTHDSAAHSAVLLSSLASPATDVSWNNFKITGLATPTAANDAATKGYADSVAQGLDAKQSVRAATTANIANLATGAPNILDGITLAANDRVLVKDQTTASANGIYTITTLGTGVNGVWARAADMDAWAEVPSSFVWVEQGTTLADTGWLCTADTGGTLGTTNIPWVQFSSAGSAFAGAGLTKTGNTLDFVAGDTSLTVSADSVIVNTAVIATVASLASYVPTSRTLTAGAGLTGGGDLSTNRAFDIGAGTGIAVAADAVSVDFTTAIATGTTIPRKYTTPSTLAGNAVYSTGEVVTHNLNTRNVLVTVVNINAPYNRVEVDWEATTVNTVTLRYSPALGAGYNCVVMG